MDVIIEVHNERKFTIEVGFFDTVLEMKQKIQKYEHIPITKQTLVFNNQVMEDERDTEFYEVLEGSRIQLHIKPDPGKPTTKIERSFSSSCLSSSAVSNKVRVIINVPSSKKQFSLEVEITDTVSHLKEKIHEVEALPVDGFLLFFNSVELVDPFLSLSDYLISDLSEVNLIIKPTTPFVAGGSSKRLKLMVLLPKSGTQKIQVEVNVLDNVGELRKELEKLQQHIQFNLPTEGYFFIYKQNVMDDDRSFRWHDVRQGDTVEIFSGNVTGGS
ncbi:hypothetical protein GIB67_040477 [Kingdonia uniflora]|uniref:Ubiquitin-like domain-containing protein n=1 Tax=Kingdonia uniflora TaxID=39325 RepID=A0A7J7L5D2_9MAGN|nr:hypothetical protein GIB67_040477 [Kingdonia uniflora]